MSASTASTRPLGTVSLLALGLNGIVGVGIFFAPADVAARAPGGLGVLVFAATALALLPVAITFATLGARFDEDGGPVLFAHAAFGERAAYVVGWVAYVSALASTAAVITGLTRATLGSLGLSGALRERLVASSLALLLAALCARGLSLTARVWTTLTVLKLVPLVGLLGAALLVDLPRDVAAPAVVSTPPTLEGLLRAGLVVTFTYQGFEIVPLVSGQARGSRRAVPIAIAGSLALAAALYVGLQWVCVRTLPALATAEAPLASSAKVIGGLLGAPVLFDVVRLGTSVSALGIAVGMMAMTPRYLASLSDRANLGLGETAVNGVPKRALAVSTLLVLVLLQAGSRAELFALSSVAVLSQYAATALALVALGLRQERGLSLARSWPAVPTLIVAAALASSAATREWVVAGGALALGALVWRLGRARTQR